MILHTIDSLSDVSLKRLLQGHEADASRGVGRVPERLHER
jgi:hypothetical protein